MTLYAFIFIMTSFFAEMSVKLKNKFIRWGTACISLLIPSYFAGIRYGIGTDYFSYKDGFEIIKYGCYSRFEIGYKFINYIVAKLGGNIQIIFFIVSFFTILFIYLALYDNKDKISVGLGMFVFMLLYYQMSYNAVRQVIAMAVLLYSYKYIFHRRLIKFLICIFLATSFHKSALLFLPMYFLYSLVGKKDRRIMKIIIIILTIIIIGNYDKIMSIIIGLSPNLNYYNHYLEKKENLNFGFGLIVMNLPYILPGFLLHKDIKIYDKKIMFFYYTYILGFIVSFIGYFGSSYINRIALNFTISNVILVPYYFRILSNKKQIFFGTLIVIAVIFLWYYNFIYLGYNQTVPYRSVYINY